MTFVTNWKDILKQAWSVKLMTISSFFAGLGQATAYVPPLMLGLSAEQMTFGGAVLGSIAGILAAASIFARLLDQGLTPKASE